MQTTSTPDLPQPHRQAIYFAPAPDHPLWQAGCRWLGRDARAGQPLSLPAHAHVAAPWRYGWHATLKAPMRLADGMTQPQWLQAVQQLAAAQSAFLMPTLQVGWLGGFLALRPAEPIDSNHPLPRLADACVIGLDHWRATPTKAELQRHLHAPTDTRRQTLARHYGYPHVLEHWRFHMTLTDDISLLSSGERITLLQAARDHFSAALSQPLRCDAICIFAEPAPGQPFVLTHRVALGLAQPS